MAESASHRKLLDGLAEAIGLDAPPDRIEVYDNSHIQGTNAVGAMIVAGPDGLLKSAYRKFKLRTLGKDADGNDAPGQAGDDYPIMREVPTRRVGRPLREDPARAPGGGAR